MQDSIHWLPLIVTSLFLLIGLVGSLVPIIPGTLIAWVGILVYKLWVPADLSWQFVGITAGLTAVAQVLDFLAGYYGTKKFGGSTQGAIGAIIGGILGPFLLTPLVGIFLGPMIGAIIGELLAKRTVYASGKSGLGTFLGGLASFVIKIALTVTMIVWFYWEVF